MDDFDTTAPRPLTPQAGRGSYVGRGGNPSPRWRGEGGARAESMGG